MEEMSTLSGEAWIGSIVITTLPTRSARKFVLAMVGARFLTLTKAERRRLNRMQVESNDSS